MAVPEIEPGANLANLIRGCEVYCVSECCGIDAFHFSPLHVAAYLSRTSGDISEEVVQTLHRELEHLESAAVALAPSENGLACSLKGTNQLFSLDALKALVNRISWAIREASAVLSLSDHLEMDYEAGHKAGEA